VARSLSWLRYPDVFAAKSSVVAALFRERPTEARKRASEPVAQHKRVWSSLSYQWGDIQVDAETEVFTWMAGEANLRRRDDQPLVCLMDGQRSLWSSCAEHLPEDRVEILDLLHVTSYLWDAACRHLVKDRMERAGMRWTIDGAQAMLDLRSTYINDGWQAFQRHRIHTETQRLYPQRRFLNQLQLQLTA